MVVLGDPGKAGGGGGWGGVGVGGGVRGALSYLRRTDSRAI